MRRPIRLLTMLGAALALTLVTATLTRPVQAGPVSVLVEFKFTGAAQTWTVPSGVTQATFDLYGAQGGAMQFAGPPGLGGRTKLTRPVTPGTVYQLVVGGRGGDAAAGVAGVPGFNGGGAGSLGNYGGSGGGGASDVRAGACAATQSCDLGARIIVAGGGGGSAVGSLSHGGSGGGLNGGDGGSSVSFGLRYGRGGTQVAGGAGGTGGFTSAQAGTLGQGGAAATVPAAVNAGGGGGGGGYYGGGGGLGLTQGSGGGGGSGFPTTATFETGVRAGDGLIQVSYQIVPNATAMRINVSVSLDGRAAPANTSVQARAGATLCGEGVTGADGRLWLEVVTAVQIPGCGTTGVPLSFTVAGRSATATPAVVFVSGGQSKSTLVVGAAPTPMRVTGTITGGAPAPKRTVEALVNGQGCGSAIAQNGAFTVMVASASSQPGCALVGDQVTFRVDGKAATGSVTFVSGGSGMVTLQLP